MRFKEHLLSNETRYDEYPTVEELEKLSDAIKACEERMAKIKELKPAKIRIPDMVGKKPNLRHPLKINYKSTDMYKTGTRDVWSLNHFGQKETIWKNNDEDN